MTSDILYDRFFELQVADIIIRDLDIIFRAVRTLKKEPNTLELTIFNLNEEKRSRLQETKDPVVQLDAGYADRHGVVFLGDVREVDSTYQKPDWVTVLSSGDGEKATQFDRINKSFRKGTNLQNVISEIGKVMSDIGPGNLLKLALSGKLPGGGSDSFINGITVSGNASREMDRLVRSAGLEWSIQDKKFQLLKAGGFLPTETVVLTPESGLIGSPTIGNDGVLTFTSLLISDIIPGKQLEIKSDLVDGRFRVERCEYVGDFAGDVWYVEGEAKEIK